MKKIITILSILTLGFFIYSCSISNPSWTNIGSERVYIENCRDTLDFRQLDSTLRENGIHPSEKEWTTMKYYNLEKDEMTQFVYTLKDTTYIVNKINNEDYVFLKRYLNKVE